jgi:hypothetical protein
VPNEEVQDPRWIRLKPSRLAVAVNGVSGAFAVAVVFFLPGDAFAMLPKALLLLAIGIVTAIYVRRALLCSPSAITAFYLVELDAKPESLLDPDSATEPAAEKLGMRISYSKRGEAHEIGATARLQPNAFVMPWFAAIPYAFDTDQAWRKLWPRLLPVWCDGIDADAFRRLRVQLKWR